MRVAHETVGEFCVMRAVLPFSDKRNEDDEWFVLIDENKFSLKLGTPDEVRVPVVGVGSTVVTAAKNSIVAGAVNPKMPRGFTTRRGLQAIALVLATAYATILLYQAVAPRQVILFSCVYQFFSIFLQIYSNVLFNYF